MKNSFSIKSLIFIAAFWLTFLLSISSGCGQSHQTNDMMLRLPLDDNNLILRDDFFGVYSPNIQSIVHPKANEFEQVLLPLKITTSTTVIELLYQTHQCDTKEYLQFKTTQLTDSISVIEKPIGLVKDLNAEYISMQVCEHTKQLDSLLKTSIDLELVSKLLTWKEGQ